MYIQLCFSERNDDKTMPHTCISDYKVLVPYMTENKNNKKQMGYNYIFLMVLEGYLLTHPQSCRDPVPVTLPNAMGCIAI